MSINDKQAFGTTASQWAMRILPFIPPLVALAYVAWLYRAYKLMERGGEIARADANAKLDDWLGRHVPEHDDEQHGD